MPDNKEEMNLSMAREVKARRLPGTCHMTDIALLNLTQDEITDKVEHGIFREICSYNPPQNMAQRFVLVPFWFGLIWNALRKLNKSLKKSRMIGCPMIDTLERKLIVVFFPEPHFQISDDQMRLRLGENHRIDSYVNEMHAAITQQPIADWKVPVPPVPALRALDTSIPGLSHDESLGQEQQSEGRPDNKIARTNFSDDEHLTAKGQKRDRSLSSSSSVEGILGSWNPRDRTFRINGAGFNGKICYDARQQDAVHSAVIFSNASVAVRVAEEHTADGLIYRLEKIEGLDPQLHIDIDICPLCHGIGQAPDHG